MCTMTWFVKEGGYELFFNRDERISRHQALPPSEHKVGDAVYLSPTDTDAGGTWIAVNHFGITVCLLNHYQFEQIETYKAWVSRGEIVRQYAVIDDVCGAGDHFLQQNLADYRAFRMFLIDASGNNCLCVWDGHTARVEASVTGPKSSSSVDALHVKDSRKQLFIDQGLLESQNRHDFIAYHAGHVPAKSKESVCMHRADANTVSFSHINVSDNNISFAYADGAPCTSQLSEAKVIKKYQAYTSFVENQAC